MLFKKTVQYYIAYSFCTEDKITGFGCFISTMTVKHRFKPTIKTLDDWTSLIIEESKKHDAHIIKNVVFTNITELGK